MLALLDDVRPGRGLTWTFEPTPGVPVQCSAGISEDGETATGSVQLMQQQFGPGVQKPIYAVTGSREAVKEGMNSYLEKLRNRLFYPALCR